MNNFIAQAEALFYDGNRRMDANDDKGAEDYFRLALHLVPNFGEALTNLALLRERAGAADEAETYYRRALELLPWNAGIYLNLGSLLLKRKRLAEAEANYRKALLLEPDSPNAWSLLGAALACMQREEEGERCYAQALQRDPDFARARFNLSYLLLRQGRLEEGWRHFEARDHYRHLEAHFTCPRWRGEALTGKTIVIGFEGGYGDLIQFSRYAALLKERGAERVTLIAHPLVASLMRSVSGVDEVLAVNREIPVNAWDFWTPVMSLPYYFGTRLDSVPAPIPYLAADAALAAKWAALLPPSGRRVGLSWKGNAKFENDADRSLPALALLAPLAAPAASGGLHFVSLQKGPGEDEAHSPPPGLTLLPLGAGLQDFADTAALVANMDLVISVDTAVAHLAGALGKECWTLLPDYRSDWRWLSGRGDTPWYPHMRLFRQPSGGGWEPVIAAVAQALAAWKRG
ncbi:MAG TPA: tetratricopeptide repeat protein [Janthinobacterium sp.]|nr:tetratricopeptide repeat protein [Janthinobacterium sp.]